MTLSTTELPAPRAQEKTVGIIGVGAMGMAMAHNLSRKGYGLAVNDIRPEAQNEGRAAGMVVCESPQEVALLADVILLVVVNAAQINEVLFGEGDHNRSLVTAGLTGKTVLICSTIAPQDTTDIALKLAQYGIACIDAPISGGPARALAGTMSMMLAGDLARLASLEPLLVAMADKRFHISAVIGDAAKAKLVNNLLAGINLVAGAEALALGIKLGLDAQKVFKLIEASSGSSWIFQDRMARALQDDFSPRAAAHILTKDVGLATAMAAGIGAPTPLGEVALARFKETLAMGCGELDDAAVIKTYLAQGLPTKPAL